MVGVGGWHWLGGLLALRTRFSDRDLEQLTQAHGRVGLRLINVTRQLTREQTEKLTALLHGGMGKSDWSIAVSLERGQGWTSATANKYAVPWGGALGAPGELATVHG